MLSKTNIQFQHSRRNTSLARAKQALMPSDYDERVRRIFNTKHVRLNSMAGPSRPPVSGGSLVATKYRLLGKIGEGSFGVICLGKDIDSREQVAVKIESARQTNQPQTLLEEARLLKALHRGGEDDNVVSITSNFLPLNILPSKGEKNEASKNETSKTYYHRRELTTANLTVIRGKRTRNVSVQNIVLLRSS